MDDMREFGLYSWSEEIAAHQCELAAQWQFELDGADHEVPRDEEE